MNKARLVSGVGVNDAGYRTSRSKRVDGKLKTVWRCPYYTVWHSMIDRCYSDRFHERFPTYSRCEADPRWHRFSEFRDWMDSQDWKGKQLDKDILSPGNKIYSPDRCIFVGKQLNSFLVDHAAGRGAYKIGVCWDAEKGKFKASCCNPFTRKVEFLGRFIIEGEAHEAWRKRKHELACQYANTQSDQRIASALMERYKKENIKLLFPN